MTAIDFNRHLRLWADGEEDTRPEEVRPLLEALLESPQRIDKDTLWPQINHELALQFLEFEGAKCGVKPERESAFLDSIYSFLITPGTKSHWRSLRVLGPNVSESVWNDFWAEFVSADIDRYNSAQAVVGPGLERGDPYFSKTVRHILADLPADHERRNGIEGLLLESDPTFNLNKLPD